MQTALAGRVAVVEVAGYRCVCRSPTVATVARALQVWPQEAAWIGCMLRPELAPEEVRAEVQAAAAVLRAYSPVEYALPLLTGPRLLEVLETCVEAPVPVPSLPVEAGEPLARAVLGLCDLARVGASLELRRATGARHAPAAGIVGVAQALGIDPAAVLRWPYEGYLDVVEALEQQARERPRSGAAVGGGLDLTRAPAVDADLSAALAQLGTGVYRRRRPAQEQ